MSQKETAPTVHGDVDYATVECASCGRTVAKQNAQRFYIGDVNKKFHWSHDNTLEVEFYDKSVESGWACDYCKQDPIEYPRGKAIDYFTSAKAIVSLTLIFLLLMVVL